MTEAIAAGAVLAAMAALAVHDARRALVDPRLVLALLGAAAAWRFGGCGPGADGTWPRLASGMLGASLGVAAVTVPIAAAALLGRRWPLYPGDAMLLGAVGFLLGPLGLAWAMALGSGLGLVHRFCVQRRRGRPFRKGLVPLGPGMCAGAAAVFLCMNFGVALAGDTRAGDGGRTAAARPLPTVSGEVDPLRLPATELGPALGALPAVLAAREVSVDWNERLPFPALVRRLSPLAGVAMRIEERPARIEGGAAVLDDPPPLRLGWHGPLAGLLDRVASLSGYGWSWETRAPESLGPKTLGPGTRAVDGAVVFFRYWDIAQRGPAHGGGTGDSAVPVAARRKRAVAGPSIRRSTGRCAACWRAGRRAPAGRWSGRRAKTTAWARRRTSGAASWRPWTSC